MYIFFIPVATFEWLFSIMGIVKSKLRNKMAIPMVEGILATRYGMKWHGETPTKITILPEWGETLAKIIILLKTMCQFNVSM